MVDDAKFTGGQSYSVFGDHSEYVTATGADIIGEKVCIIGSTSSPELTSPQVLAVGFIQKGVRIHACILYVHVFAQ